MFLENYNEDKDNRYEEETGGEFQKEGRVGEGD